MSVVDAVCRPFLLGPAIPNHGNPQHTPDPAKKKPYQQPTFFDGETEGTASRKEAQLAQLAEKERLQKIPPEACAVVQYLDVPQRVC